jgi:hypothetical protein
MKKILLACPVSNYKDYILDKWIDYIQKLTYEVDYLFVDNSKKKGYIDDKTKRLNRVKTIYVEPKAINIVHTIAQCQEVIREYALANNYDYLFSLECDIFPKDLNIIQKLLSYNLEIVSGWYFIGFDDTLTGGFNKLIGNKSTKISLRESMFFINGFLQPVHNAGIGCTLFSNKLLQNIKFRAENKNGIAISSDSVLASDLVKLGIQNMVDTSSFCLHYNMDWNALPEYYL